MKIFLGGLLIIFGFSSTVLARDLSRPESPGGDQLVEVNLGIFIEGEQTEPELGFDYEYFVSGTEHHLSVGAATDVSFGESHTEFYLGPLVSGYYHHFKLFWTSGVSTANFVEAHERHRTGLGYEIFDSVIYVPSLAYEKNGDKEGVVVMLGVAQEF